MRLGLVAVSLLALAVVANAAPITSINQSDWGLAQVGADGTKAGQVNGNRKVDFSVPGTLKLGGAYGQSSVALIKGGDNNDGKFLDVNASITFNALSGSTFAPGNTGVNFGMGLRQFTALAPVDYNTYPVYRVDYLLASQTLVIREESGYNRFRTLATSSALSLAAGSAVYQLQFGVNNDASGNAVLTAKLYENGLLKADLSGTDFAKAASQEGTGDWADNGTDVYNAGYMSLIAGGTDQNLVGLNITGITVPEPATMSLLGLGLVGLLRRRSR